MAPRLGVAVLFMACAGALAAMLTSADAARASLRWHGAAKQHLLRSGAAAAAGGAAAAEVVVEEEQDMAQLPLSMLVR